MIVDLVVLDSYSDNGWKAKETGNNRVTRSDSGAVRTLQKWLYSMRRFEIPFHLMPWAQYQLLRNFWICRGMGARGFLLWDVSNFYAAAQNIGTGNGATTAFQIQLTYADTVNPVQKPIYHPVPTGTAIPIQLQGVPGGTSVTANHITVNGVAKVEGTDYTVSPSTGLVTFTAAPPAGYSILWTGWLYTPVMFEGPEFPMDLDSIYADVVPSLVELFYQ